VAIRREQLVVQYLEDMSSAVLNEYQVEVREYVKGRYGIYALYHGHKLYYVGLASNLRSRLQNHLRDRHHHHWNRFSLYLTKSGQHLREIEAVLLRVASPGGNRSKTRLPHAQNLRQQLGKRIKASQKSELASLFGTVESSRRKQTLRAVKGRRIRLSDVIEGRFPIVMTYKGNAYRATVLANGSIRMKGRTYQSPSLAAVQVAKRAANGWLWWKYERAPGDWVALDTLRKK
jgi:hypothetical protein